VRLTQSQFKPIRISSRLWIVPSWEQVPDANAINIRLDPGAAFGTGSHATTRLCLAWLEANLRGGETVLDYGCGSGILAIAALRLGAARATGVDIDPQAVLAARANAMQNRVSADFHAPGDEPRPASDVVLANILAGPLIALAPLLAAATRPAGRIVLSGVLEAQAEEVIAAYSAWYAMSAPVLDEGWALLAGVKTRTRP
jgi:ribosomal protein L11 methyltransferase